MIEAIIRSDMSTFKYSIVSEKCHHLQPMRGPEIPKLLTVTPC